MRGTQRLRSARGRRRQRVSRRSSRLLLVLLFSAGFGEVAGGDGDDPGGVEVFAGGGADLVGGERFELLIQLGFVLHGAAGQKVFGEGAGEVGLARAVHGAALEEGGLGALDFFGVCAFGEELADFLGDGGADLLHVGGVGDGVGAEHGVGLHGGGGDGGADAVGEALFFTDALPEAGGGVAAENLVGDEEGGVVGVGVLKRDEQA